MLGVGPQRGGGRGMERHEARLPEFGVLNLQAWRSTVAIVERRTRQLDACRIVSGAVVDQNDAELVDGTREDVAVLPKREVEVPVVVQVRKVPFQVIPGFRRVVAQRSRRARLVDRERAVSVVHHEVAGDVGAADAVDPQVDVAVAVDVASRRRLQMQVANALRPPRESTMFDA